MSTKEFDKYWNELKYLEQLEFFKENRPRDYKVMLKMSGLNEKDFAKKYVEIRQNFEETRQKLK